MYDVNDIGELPDYRTPPYNKPRRVIERFYYFDIHQYPEEVVRRSIASYYAAVSFVDDCVGRIMKALDEEGLRDDTLTIYSTDHGENMYAHGLCEKHTMYDTAVRIPLIFSLPGVIPEGRETDTMISNVDILPTVLRMNDIDTPEFCDGVDMRPIFNGDDVREHVFSEYYHILEPTRMVRDRRWKYIHTEEDICELYDIKNDPDERINLAWYPQYAARVKAMEQIVLKDWDIPELPIHAMWNDLNERKQRQRLQGLSIQNYRPALPEWAQGESG